MFGIFEKLIEKIVAVWLERVAGGKASTVAGILAATGVAITAYTDLIPEHYKPYVIGVSAMLTAIAGMMGYGPKGKLPVFILFVLGFMTLGMATAQGPQNIYGAGVSYSVNAKPSVAGTAMYSYKLTDSNTYFTTTFDVLPNTIRPFTVSSNVGAGVAQKVATIANHNIYCLSTAGVSWTGSNTGWQFNGGCATAFKVGTQGFSIVPTFRFLKSNVTNGTGYQPVFGLLYVWGK